MRAEGVPAHASMQAAASYLSGTLRRLVGAASTAAQYQRLAVATGHDAQQHGGGHGHAHERDDGPGPGGSGAPDSPALHGTSKALPAFVYPLLVAAVRAAWTRGGVQRQFCACEDGTLMAIMCGCACCHAIDR